MLQKFKKQLILSSIMILLPILPGCFLWDQLKDIRAICIMPLFLLATHWLCILITAKDAGNQDQNHKVFGMVLWILPILSLIVCGISYSLALGYSEGASLASGLLIRVMLGLFFILFGNYMPKCKQNHTIGIKVVWALRNEENWNKTHRFAGKLWFFGGIVILASLLIPFEAGMAVFFVILLILAFAPMIYSYLYYRKQLKEGTACKDDATLLPAERKVTKISIGIIIFSLVLVALLLTSGGFEITLAEEAMTVEASFWGDITVPYTDIDSIEYREQDHPGSRTYGFGSPTLLMGKFQNAEFGAYTRYSYPGCDSCIVITMDDEILVINETEEDATEKLYEALADKIGQ